MPAGQATAAPPEATVRYAARIDASAVRRPRAPAPAASPVLSAPAPPTEPSTVAGPVPCRWPSDPGPELSRRRAPAVPPDRIAGDEPENRGHATQTRIPAETRAGRRNPPVAATAPPTPSQVFGVRGRRRSGGCPVAPAAGRTNAVTARPRPIAKAATVGGGGGGATGRPTDAARPVAADGRHGH